MNKPEFLVAVEGSVPTPNWQNAIASTLAPFEMNWINDNFGVDGETLFFSYTASTIMTCCIKKNNFCGEEPENIQSRVRSFDKLFIVGVWFPKPDGKGAVGVLSFFSQFQAAELYRRRVNITDLYTAINMIELYDYLNSDARFASGKLRKEFADPIAVMGAWTGQGFRSACSDLNGVWTEAKVELFSGWSDFPEETYHHIEPVMYATKRRVERAVLWSLLRHAISGHGCDKLIANEVASTVEKVLDGCVVPLTWKGEFLGKVIHPLLVSFWVEDKFIGGGPGSGVRDHFEVDCRLRWVPTRDQVVWCLYGHDEQMRNRQILDLRELVEYRNQSYDGRLFEGVAPYVYVSGAPVSSENIYEDPLLDGKAFSQMAMNFDGGDKFSQEYIEERRRYRQRVSDLELIFWGRDSFAFLDLPIWGAEEVEAVLQFQTTRRELLKRIEQAGIYELIQDVRLTFPRLGT
ncbi:MAG: hypothetical protein K0U74_03095 [Alphaproteobacteria bacterium]|nr:hypothetical protein [Alphaproteobacteria bacterium]